MYANLKITIPIEYTFPPQDVLPNGTPNGDYAVHQHMWIQKTAIDSAIDSRVLDGSWRKAIGDRYVWFGQFDLRQMNWSAVTKIVQLGGDVERWPAFIKIADPDALTPDALPNRIDSVYDEETETNTETEKTWRQWCRPNSPPIQIESEWYIASAANDGKHLPVSILKQLNELQEIEIVSQLPERPDVEEKAQQARL